jgi:Putative zinc-finger
MATQHLKDEQLSAYIDHALANKDAAAIAGHLDGCADCVSRMQLLRATSQAVASLPEEELPRPLDLGFLRDGAAGVEELGSRGFVARVIHGRPPTWLPTAVAAAAVLALVVTWVPRLVPARGGQSQATAGVAPATRTEGRGASTPGALSVVPSVAPNSVAPNSSFPEAARKTVVGRDGSTIALLANPPSATTGHPVQLLLRLVGGPRGTDLAPPGMEILAGQGQSQLRLGGSEGTSRTVQSGEELDLTVEWSAGAITGPPAPGTYSLIGRIFLKNSTVVEVPLTFTVSS